jgi:hypothetical protein
MDSEKEGNSGAGAIFILCLVAKTVKLAYAFNQG